MIKIYLEMLATFLITLALGIGASLSYLPLCGVVVAPLGAHRHLQRINFTRLQPRRQELFRKAVPAHKEENSAS